MGNERIVLRLLACGDRYWSDKHTINIVLNGYLATYGDDLILIEGEAPGADHYAGLWAEKNGLTVPNGRLLKFPAHWRHHKAHHQNCEDWCVRPPCPPDCKRFSGRAAGTIRNKQQMVEGRAEEVVAFHDNLLESKGTLSMCTLAQKANLPVMVVGSFWRPNSQLF
jgi:hypothetical protein